MKSHNILGVELREGKNRKCLINIQIGDKYVHITKGTKEFIFSKKEIEKIFKEVHE